MIVEKIKVKKQTIKEKSFKKNLMVWFVFLALAPMLVVSWITYFQTNIILKENANFNLEQTSREKTEFIKNWFDYRFTDLKNHSEDRQNAKLLMILSEGFNEFNKPLSEYVKSFDWAKRVDAEQNNLKTLLRNYDYIYDIFLIDNSGNVLFSVIRESDFGSNLFNEPLSQTLFSKSVRETMNTGRLLFSDMERYSPSNNEIAGFMIAPLLDDVGNKIGVFAIQLKLNRIMDAFSVAVKKEFVSHHYLVGEDGYLRTPIDGGNREILRRSIETEQMKLWKLEHTGEGKESEQQQEHSFNYIGPSGNEVIGLHQSISIPGVKWVLISEINLSQALIAGKWLEQTIFFLLLGSGLVASILAYGKAKQITQPIINLANASMGAAVGQLDFLRNSSKYDELIQLTDSFNHMLKVRNEQEQSLILSNKETQKALDSLAAQRAATDEHSIVAITNIRGDIIFCNDKFCDISGYHREELIGKNHRILNSGFHEKEFFTDMYKQISKGEVWHGEICNRSKNGMLYWVDSTLVPTKDINGKIINYIAIRTDISELKLIEESLIEAKQAAELANKAKGEFLANMSHEIRTPMNGVLGMTNLLLDSSLDEQQRHRTETLKRSAESLLVVINDILDISKIEAGKLDIELVDFDLGIMIEDFASTMAYKAEEKQLELICPANPIIHSFFKGDPGRIRQVLTNLVGNALKFTEQGEVSVSYEVEGEEEDFSQIKFVVNDTGIGLSEEQQKNLFERFTQADGSTTREYGGTGLGLSISKQLVELMDGEIGVNGTLGKGSTFWFRLPLEISSSISSPPILNKLTELQQEKILVVDDNATSRELLAALLNNWGVEHVVTKSGPLALEKLYAADEQGEPFTISIIDMRMPGMNGMQFAQVVKNDKKVSQLKMILLTCQSRRGSDSEMILDSGFCEFLSKPINQSSLYNSLQKISGVDVEKELQLTAPSLDKVQQFQARILVVEDNTTNQEVAKGMLEKFGIVVDVVENGKEALVSLEEFPYDLVFMDCQMPVMDGYQATQHIRSKKSKVLEHKIPVIAMTANVMPSDIKKCEISGMDGHIAKPIDPEKLVKMLRKWLPQPTNNKQAEKKLSKQKRRENDLIIEPSLESVLVLDYDALSKRMMNDEDLIRTIVSAFIVDMEKQVKILSDSVLDNNCEKICLQSHKIKGASANVGGMKFSSAALEMEVLAKEKNILIIQEKLSSFEDKFLQLKSALENKIL